MSPVPMPSEMSDAVAAAFDEIKARRVRRFERRVSLSRRRKQKMMALLRVASSNRGGVWSWLKAVGLDAGASCVRDAVQRAFERLPIEQAQHAPPGSLVVSPSAVAVKGFGGRLYGDAPVGPVLGIFAPT